MMEKRVALEKARGVANPIKNVQREIAQIFTRGTHFDLTSVGPDVKDFVTKYVLAFVFDADSAPNNQIPSEE